MQARANMGLYRSQVVESVWLEETTYEFNEENEYTLPLATPIVAGATYKVRWNGTEYVCIAKSVFDGAGIAFGNGIVVNEEDTGEPFSVQYVPAYGGAFCILIDYSVKEKVTFSIIEIAEQITPVPQAYLVNAMPYYVEIIDIDGVITTAETPDHLKSVAETGRPIFFRITQITGTGNNNIMVASSYTLLGGYDVVHFYANNVAFVLSKNAEGGYTMNDPT